MVYAVKRLGGNVRAYVCVVVCMRIITMGDGMRCARSGDVEVRFGWDVPMENGHGEVWLKMDG